MKNTLSLLLLLSSTLVYGQSFDGIDLAPNTGRINYKDIETEIIEKQILNGPDITIFSNTLVDDGQQLSEKEIDSFDSVDYQELDESIAKSDPHQVQDLIEKIPSKNKKEFAYEDDELDAKLASEIDTFVQEKPVQVSNDDNDGDDESSHGPVTAEIDDNKTGDDDLKEEVTSPDPIESVIDENRPEGIVDSGNLSPISINKEKLVATKKTQEIKKRHLPDFNIDERNDTAVSGSGPLFKE